MKSLSAYLFRLLLTLVITSPLHAAERIAVAGGSITEILYRLGAQDKIIAVDSTSTYQAADKKYPLLGYVRNISVEGLLSLSPDLLIGENDTGPSKALEQVRAVGLKTVIIEEDGSIPAIKQKIREVGKLVQAEARAEQLIEEIQLDIDALKYANNRLQEISATKPKVLFLLTLQNGSPIAAGNHTSAHTTITAAGGNNALKNEKGWIKLSPEAALDLNPDVIVVMNRPDAPLESVAKLAHFKYTKAVKNNAVYSIDGGYLLGFGPRTPQAIVELGTMIHDSFPLPSGYQFRYDNQQANTGHGS